MNHAIVVLRLSEKRKKFVLKHRKMFNKEVNEAGDAKIVKLARKEIGYSERTNSTDIMRALTRVWVRIEKGA